ncbi:MAG: sodium/proton-translocating pyrophosphatase [Armatimonadetes bacterium]|nr:sodium/proton-translocating pyrophosphatase [Armatimonadota bacterium]
MKSLQLAKGRALSTPTRLRLLGIFVLGLLSSFAFAGEGENVHLQFASSDNTTLIIAAVLGLLGIFMAAFLGKGIASEDRGSEGMREVQDAIESGARAYLKKQINMMAPFIIILAILLFLLYKGSHGNWAWGVSITFILGVVSSYMSGFAGMIMAVKGNARVAAAALTSNKKALEIAFKSGSVAGLMTVGIGLFFSSLILRFAPANAIILLIGYGFGGSLAALFMRVGGGIYTKAADVGADLVGKVEQSMPEDSPRNPATIADNVGDNVGDCAGMAADVFESYEVMLVATIVLGAATASVLDASVWPKLIVFALAACGIGIVASIMGIQFVKGSDDVETDPLKPILTGFRITALLAGIGTAILAAVLLKDVNVQELVTQQAANVRLTKKIVAIRDDYAKQKGIDKTAVQAKDLLSDEKIKALGFTDKDENRLSSALFTTPDMLKNDAALEGYREVSADDIKNVAFPALNYAVEKPQTDATAPSSKTEFITVADMFNPTKDPLVAAKLTVHQSAPAQNGQPARSADQVVWVSGATVKDLNEQLDKAQKAAMAQGGSLKIDVDKDHILPIKLFYNQRDDKFAMVAGIGVDKPEMFQTMFPYAFFRKSVSDMESISGKIKVDPKSATMPESVAFDSAAAVVVAKAEWWRFALALIFGIIMAMGIEALTNYYVGTSKRPTKEVAGVATTGPAPMIIQGFAYGAESSVFMVIAIVIALMVPLFLFPAATFGSMVLGFYGIALVGLGLLTTTGYILAMDTFGPISDNAQGVFEMSGESHNEYGSKSLQRLDAAGNTTKALTKGFAIATAVVAAVALFQSYVGAGQLESMGLRIDVPEIFMGLLIGAAAPYLFSSFAINAVGRSAFELIHEVRRQFRENPKILTGTDKPDYGRCVEIVTAAAQRELLGPGILAICLPIAVGFGFSLLPGTPVTIGDHVYNLKGAQALGGFLAGAIASGQLMAVLLSNSGGMWDNAKKLIEDGMFGGKGTEAHRAAVVCDTVGDPFKDTAGPALNPLIKVMNLVALLIVGVVIESSISVAIRGAVTAVAIALLVFAFWRSKQGSLADKMQHMND